MYRIALREASKAPISISKPSEHKIHIDTSKVEKVIEKTGKDEKKTTALVVENKSVPMKMKQKLPQKKPITQLEEENEPALEGKKENLSEEKKEAPIEKKKEGGIMKKVSGLFGSLLKRK